MKKDAEIHATEDKKKQEAIEVKNLADSMVYTAEKTLKDAGDKVPADMKKTAEEKIAALKESQKADSIDDIRVKTKDLSEHMQKIGTELYKNNPSQTSHNQEGKKTDEKPKDEPKAEEGEFKEKE